MKEENMGVKIAIAHMGDSRDDFYGKRKGLVEEEIEKLGWLKDRFEVIESDVLRSKSDIVEYAHKVNTNGATCLIIHIPIWSDPIFSIILGQNIQLPVILLGNSRPDTSSYLGVLGSGGALNQVGCFHTRIFDGKEQESQRKISAFIFAAAARQQLKGKTLGLFGGRSLGMLTTCTDAAQWQKLFGVDIEFLDQMEIVEVAEEIHEELIERHTNWLLGKLASCEFGGNFTMQALKRQVRGYIAVKNIIKEKGIDFVGVKCQSELTNGYASHCLAHMLLNGTWDADGKKQPVVHACECDADGALTMQILQLISEGKPTALLDVRWYDKTKKKWIFTNCGATCSYFFSDNQDETGLSNVKAMQHAFGEAGGGAYQGVVKPQPLTLARLCRKNGEYWMTIIEGKIEEFDKDCLKYTTACFPQALVNIPVGEEFLQDFDSNHLHMVSGCYAQELKEFCRQSGIKYSELI